MGIHVTARSSGSTIYDSTVSGDRILIGRSADCQVTINHDLVSRRHLELREVNGQWQVRDLRSANGTYLNDTQLEPEQLYPLNPGDRLRLGSSIEVTAEPTSAEADYAETPTSGPTERSWWQSAPLLIVIAILLLAAGAGAAYLLMRVPAKESNQAVVATVPAPTSVIAGVQAAATEVARTLPAVMTSLPIPTIQALVPTVEALSPTVAAAIAGAATPAQLAQSAPTQPRPVTPAPQPTAAPAQAAQVGQPAAPVSQPQVAPAASSVGPASQGATQPSPIQPQAGQQAGAGLAQGGAAPGQAGAGLAQGGAAAGQAGAGLAQGGAAAGPMGGMLGQLPQMLASAFPGVAPGQLPGAMQQGAEGGQIQPDQMRQALGALFPGVAPAQMPAAMAGSFAGFNPQQIDSVLGYAYPGQTPGAKAANPQGGDVIFASLAGDAPPWNIYQMNANGTGKKMLIGEASEPAFSPDGSRLVYFSRRPDALGLRIRDLATGDDQALTTDQGDAYPSWSPDGQEIVFWNVDTDEIQVISADRSKRRHLTYGQFPAWSPRGDRIAYKGCLGNDCGIILVKPDGGDPVRITTNANDGQPAWSRDGQRVAFVSNRDGNWEIYVVNADGSWLRRVTNDPHTDGLPAWSPDGITLAFRSDRSGKWAIYTVSGFGGAAFQVTEAPVSSEGYYQWTWEKLSWR